ncbi:carbohydrate binding module [Aspergillus campestris IBT 28561]|uniref:Carbohydrate binding module n=1 Tax=Aspergillus campestris (strain IBT 28561) TaxID=1392248 RepID=A0A2I1CRU8_ASPC2|nr:carbohydrate binding module [Aspergillus campestris IBT 28561]PKY00350.1 carbohydrate binding module [Aspergillus campestris IBT 28561]
MSSSKSWLSAAWLLSVGQFLTSPHFAKADNPIVQTLYTSDPAPFVYDDRVYLFTGHDEDGPNDNYNMLDWQLFSSADMANWQYHGSPLSLDAFPWASINAWAGQVIERNDKFYWYVPVSNDDWAFSIGVAVADNITGPYVDAIGEALVAGSEIDPTVFIDDDGQAYLYWGNPGLFYVKLNEDMISYSGEVVEVELTEEGFGSRDDPETPTMYQEGPWLYKRGDLYYMIFAAKCCPENIQYSTGPSATGPWTYGGVIMDSAGTSGTNHVGIVEYKDTPYFFYHNGALPGGGSYTRSVCLESFEYNPDGTFPTLKMTEEGPAQIGALDPYVRQEAETIAWSEGLKTVTGEAGVIFVGKINDGDFIKVKGVAFKEGATKFSASVASEVNGGSIELHLGAVDGKVIGTCAVEVTGGWEKWKTVSCPVEVAADTTDDLFFKFIGDSADDLFNVDWWQFE